LLNSFGIPLNLNKGRWPLTPLFSYPNHNSLTNRKKLDFGLNKV